MPISPDRGAVDWVRAALAALRTGGVEAVRVEPLARSLGCTKGSFYWHFRDRDALLDALLVEWERRSGTRFLERIEAASAEPVERLRLLMETVISEGRGAVDPAVRAWALRDARAAATLARVDTARLAWLGRLFEALGFAAPEAAARARLAYFALIGEHALRSAADIGERLALARRTLDLLIRPAQPAGNHT